MKLPGIRRRLGIRSRIRHSRNMTDFDELVIWAARLESALVKLLIKYKTLFKYSRHQYQGDYEAAFKLREDVRKVIYPVARNKAKYTPEFMVTVVQAFDNAAPRTRREVLRSLGISHKKLLEFKTKLKAMNFEKSNKTRNKLEASGYLPAINEVKAKADDFVVRLARQRARDQRYLKFRNETKLKSEFIKQQQEDAKTKALYHYTEPPKQEPSYLAINRAPFELDLDDDF